MSIVTLLVDFPNYSARKVRRLAKQVAFVEQVAEHADEPSVAKGIAADLMEYNLLQARTESTLNDDVPQNMEVVDALRSEPAHGLPLLTQPNTWFGKVGTPANLAEAVAEIREMRADWEKLGHAMGFKEFVDVEVMLERAKAANPNLPTERTTVTPLSEAVRAIEEFESLRGIEDETGSCLVTQISRAKGIVRGSSFMADRYIERITPKERT
jgi:hypothetical protein